MLEITVAMIKRNMDPYKGRRNGVPRNTDSSPNPRMIPGRVEGNQDTMSRAKRPTKFVRMTMYAISVNSTTDSIAVAPASTTVFFSDSRNTESSMTRLQCSAVHGLETLKEPKRAMKDARDKNKRGMTVITAATASRTKKIGHRHFLKLCLWPL